ncbi:MAG: HEPN domain-containing protein, partial [Proteobacteria bacterium]|nr:HEPN domain-containing protein [Pseudomonadota bacterium]
MTREVIVAYWLEKAVDDAASAEANRLQGRYQNAVRDAYFACFHAFTALLFEEGKIFKKHREVRMILHRDYLRTGK